MMNERLSMTCDTSDERIQYLSEKLQKGNLKKRTRQKTINLLKKIITGLLSSEKVGGIIIILSNMDLLRIFQCVLREASHY